VILLFRQYEAAWNSRNRRFRETQGMECRIDVYVKVSILSVVRAANRLKFDACDTCAIAIRNRCSMTAKDRCHPATAGKLEDDDERS
jgi:hypothetical protein